jgi:hypothetical protein
MDEPETAPKSRAQLQQELEALRQQLTSLAAGLVAGGETGDDLHKPLAAREERQPLQADIEFIGDFDIVQARGVDVSSRGICFEVDAPLAFEMKVNMSGSAREYRAQLVWMRQLDGERCRLGFRFV